MSYGVGQNRTPGQREADFVKLADLYLKGASRLKMVAAIGVSRQQIHLDLKELHRRWLEEEIDKVSEQKQRMFRVLDNLEAEAQAAWERSQKDAEKKVTTKKATGENEEQLSVEGQCGDPRFLQLVKDCQDRRAKLLGLDAPKTVDVTTKGESVKGYMIVSPDDWDPKPEEVKPNDSGNSGGVSSDADAAAAEVKPD